MQVFIPGLNYVILGHQPPTPGPGPDPSIPRISAFDVYFTPDSSGVEIRWDKTPGAEVEEFRIYRSTTQEPSTEDLELVATVVGTVFSYTHATGTQQDYYTITTVIGGQESSPYEPLGSAQDFVPAMCKIRGQIIDISGARLVDVKVVAKLVTPPKIISKSLVSKKANYVLSGEDGRFEISVLQGAEIVLVIDEVQVSDPIKVPNVPSIDYNELEIYDQYRFEDRLNA